MEVKSISSANTQFGLDLFKVVQQEKKNENIFLSPFSISVALAMTQLGAREETAKEMASTLRWNVSDENQIHQEFEQYVGLLQTASDKYELSMANRIYIEKSLEVVQEFITRTKQHYKAEPVAADFAGDSEVERVKINEWVEQQTQNKIKDLLAPGVLNSLTRLVLVNAIYFKGLWHDQFKPQNTAPRSFKVAPSNTKNVPMMSAKRKYGYYHSRSLKCQIVELPYKGKELSMVIILPDEDFGLESLMADLDADTLTSLLSSESLRYEEIDLRLPKFKVSSSFSLASALQDLGMVQAFSEQSANFVGMTGNQDLHISAVVHKAFVQVDEQGTEAAAATGVAIGLMSMPLPPREVTVDHPFLFVIKDGRCSNSVLFMGSVLDPSAE